MAASIPSLPDLQAFEAASRHGSFVGAAHELHLTASAVSHRVKMLERRLGVPLFTRHARRVTLTDHGRAYAPVVRRAFDELSSSTAGLFGRSGDRPRLTVRAPISYAVRCIAPRLSDFLTRHPDTSVRVVSAIWADTLADDDVDIDIRYGTGTWPGHDSELLHRETVVHVWSERFERRHGAVRARSDLDERPQVHVLGIDDPELGAATPADVTVDTSLAALALVEGGTHSAVLLRRFVSTELSTGRLRSLDPTGSPTPQSHWVVTPRGRIDAGTSVGAAFVLWLREIAD